MQRRRLRPLWGAFFLLPRLTPLVNMNNGVRAVYHGISNSCRLLSIDMRYNINSRRVIHNNIAHSGCQMSYFCCIMDYLSGISWPFLVPTYPRVLPIFPGLSLASQAGHLPFIGHWETSLTTTKTKALHSFMIFTLTHTFPKHMDIMLCTSI